MDLNPFLAVGIDAPTMTFLNGFLLFCLLRNSPPSDLTEYDEIDANFKAVVKRGRDPALRLSRNGTDIDLKTWSCEILDEVKLIAAMLDSVNGDTACTTATAAQLAKVNNSELTPSAQVLQRMRELKTSYYRFAMNQSLANSDYFRSQKPDSKTLDEFLRMSATSKLEQTAIEANDDVDFATYLQNLNDS